MEGGGGYNINYVLESILKAIVGVGVTVPIWQILVSGIAGIVQGFYQGNEHVITY